MEVLLSVRFFAGCQRPGLALIAAVVRWDGLVVSLKGCHPLEPAKGAGGKGD
jgi:hypothetical protein